MPELPNASRRSYDLKSDFSSSGAGSHLKAMPRHTHPAPVTTAVCPCPRLTQIERLAFAKVPSSPTAPLSLYSSSSRPMRGPTKNFPRHAPGLSDGHSRAEIPPVPCHLCWGAGGHLGLQRRVLGKPTPHHCSHELKKDTQLVGQRQKGQRKLPRGGSPS